MEVRIGRGLKGQDELNVERITDLEKQLELKTKRMGEQHEFVLSLQKQLADSVPFEVIRKVFKERGLCNSGEFIKCLYFLDCTKQNCPLAGKVQTNFCSTFEQ